ncbi:hypothetical protein MasN3_16010 [Massilia varians]|uniref:Helix-turn-helix domain-containing protein n=1 Tax=Massilia varians TaxID=457921 RepID=A0ABM8C4G7_9BURK|nr:hypothetical protein [Massilia varians]BDT58107.1 hypothetical protein MasN3_16010 [Massilia varians]
MFLEERISVLERQIELLSERMGKIQAELSHLATKSKAPPRELPDAPTLTTKEAARLLNRAPQTLRVWAMYENGPIRPQRVNKRLQWATADVMKLVAHGDQ